MDKNLKLLTGFLEEVMEYESSQRHFREGRGFSNDKQRFERYFFYLKEFGKLDPDNTVLDAGCGPGPLEVYLRKYGFKTVYALDFSEEGIKRCKERSPNYFYTVGNINRVGEIYKDLKFDVVFCCQVLEHLKFHKEVLKQLYDLVDNGGLLVISVPWGTCKSSTAHINHYFPGTFEQIAKEIGIPGPIVVERFAENDLQMLVIFEKGR